MATQETTPRAEGPRVLFVVTTRDVSRLAAILVLLGLSFVVLRTYALTYNPQDGWSRMILFGGEFADHALPRLKRVRHYVWSTEGARKGYDGQYYAQLGIDPSLQDPNFESALDMPRYRARRIALPALSFLLGQGKPRRIIQIYAVANLFFWFLLLAVMAKILWPWNWRRLLGLSAAMLTNGIVASMLRGLIDLPAAALLMLGAVVAGWGGCAVWAVAVLTRETSLLAVGGWFDWRQAWNAAFWRKRAGMLALVALPLALWLAYVARRFPGLGDGMSNGNFA